MGWEQCLDRANTGTLLLQGMPCLQMAVATCPPSANIDQGPAAGQAQGWSMVLWKGTWAWVKGPQCLASYVTQPVCHLASQCVGGEVPRLTPHQRLPGRGRTLALG